MGLYKREHFDKNTGVMYLILAVLNLYLDIWLNLINQIWKKKNELQK